jgi:hypothetical protein
MGLHHIFSTEKNDISILNEKLSMKLLEIEKLTYIPNKEKNIT